MTTGVEIKFQSSNSKKTEAFASKLAQQLKGGEIIELIGDVGSGKTTFTIGLAKGLASNDVVSSPTFTIHNVYRGRLDLHHCDFYRLHNDELIKRELAEMITDSSVVALEWAEEVKNVLPAVRITICFSSLSESERELQVSIPREFDYIKL